jgi:hypothetical protein
VEWFWQKGPSHGEVHIASRDKDMLQLVWWNDSNGNGTLALDPQSGKLGGPVEVEARYGVTPAQMVDYLALVGDSSDNVRGVEKVGAKHAQRLLAKYGTASKLWGALDEKKDGKWAIEPPSVRDSLIASADVFALARKLITLRTDAPIDCKALEKQHETSAGFAAGEGTQQTSHTQPGRGAEEPGTFSEAEFEEEADTEPAPPQASASPLHATPSQTQGAAPPSPAGVAEEPGTSTALVRVEAGFKLELEPRSANNAMMVSKILFNSGIFRRKHETPESIFAVILAGRTMGLDAMTALRGIHMIEGKPEMSSSLMVGLVLNSGKAEYFDLVESSDKIATWETKRFGGRREVRMSFTIEQAKRAGLVGKGTWQKHPEAMLLARSSAMLARAVYPDIVSNVYSPGELEEAS